ncbi:hypothetical protein NW752_004170 [Fusarium irregulare]|uniref:Uncharacterized protein n=1 Tax=Fusarium irregulare TaxID=2494466 RepID=A0A9W8U961_9HYPO|nr:hypothetical protein NW766_007069 [Fusarium irregulare]KAJ4021163.1 hypothetical protein NW752_004170 [Fusarium irregulare]
MRYLQNIVLLISILGAAPTVLAAAPVTESSAVEVAKPNAADAQPLPVAQNQDEDEDDDDEGLTGNDGAAVLAQLESRARVKCLTRGRPGKNCYHSQCPGNKQCKVNARGNCVFKLSQKKRPFGCSQCLCYRSSI